MGSEGRHFVRQGSRQERSSIRLCFRTPSRERPRHLLSPSESRPGELGYSSRAFIHVLLVTATASMIGIWGGIWMAENRSVNQRVNALVPALGELGKQPSGSGSAPDRAKAAVPEVAESKSLPEESTDRGKRLEFPTIGGIHYSCQPGITRLEIEMGMSVLARVGRLHDPERIYFDFQNDRRAKVPVRLSGEQKIQDTTDTVLAGIRMAPRGVEEVRVVLDMKCSCEYSYNQSTEPSPRLIVELRPPALHDPARK